MCTGGPDKYLNTDKSNVTSTNIAIPGASCISIAHQVRYCELRESHKNFCIMSFSTQLIIHFV